MRVTFEFLSSPVELKKDSISVIVIEHKETYRKVLASFLEGCPDEDKIFFSLDYVPFKFKGNVLVIDNYFSLDFSTAFMKKIYDDISRFCVSEMLDSTLRLKEGINDYFENIIQNYDYDFYCKEEIELIDLFKAMNLKPNLLESSMTDALLDYMLLIQKYTPHKCFVLFNLHLYFSEGELASLYKEFLKSDFRVLVIEGRGYDKMREECITIIDEDMCEIVEFH